MSENEKKLHRGFSTMNPDVHREISVMGGKAAHAAGKAYRWNSETAAKAGSKGGSAPHKSRGGARRARPQNENPEVTNPAAVPGEFSPSP